MFAVWRHVKGTLRRDAMSCVKLVWCYIYVAGTPCTWRNEWRIHDCVHCRVSYKSGRVGFLSRSEVLHEKVGPQNNLHNVDQAWLSHILNNDTVIVNNGLGRTQVKGHAVYIRVRTSFE